MEIRSLQGLPGSQDSSNTLWCDLSHRRLDSSSRDYTVATLVLVRYQYMEPAWRKQRVYSLI